MMSRLVRRLATVNDWFDTEVNGMANTYALSYAFATALQNQEIFNHVYIPVKLATEDGMPDEFTYVNIGIGTNDLAEYYDVYFGENWLVEKFDTSDINACSQKLSRRIKRVFEMNKGKYLKLIELLGYEYNPIWNVDGVEEYTYLENSGVNDINVSKTIGSYTDTHGGTETTEETHEDTNSATSFDSTDFNDTDHNAGGKNETTTTSGDAVTHGSHTDTDNTTVTHHNADNNGKDYSGGTDTFGNTVIGGDKYHNERKVRQGNIGVTKTQELIAAERENLKFSVIMEFFKDINEQILVGIY